MSVGYIYGNREETTHKGKGMILRDTLNAEMEILKQIVIMCHIKYGDIKCSLTKLFR